MGHLPVFSDREFSWDADLLYGVGRLVCAWGMLEQSLEEKIGNLRQASGDVRGVGVRNKPGMARMMAELRAMISMRDRRNTAAMTEITAIERDIQRIDRFRGLVVSGFTSPEPGGFACRDPKNNMLHVSFQQLDGEIAQLETIGERLLAL